MKKVCFILIFISGLFTSLDIFAATITSIRSGSWNDLNTWDLGRVPQNGDVVVVDFPEGGAHEVYIPKPGRVIFNGEIRIFGVFDVQGKLEMDRFSTILLAQGSEIKASSEGNSERIIIGDQEIRGDQINLIASPNQLTEGTLTRGGCSANPGECEPNPLPVTLLYFKATAQHQAIEITWASSKAWDFSHYELERSADGLTFAYLATIEAEETSNETVEFSYTDRQPLSGTSYYRLKAVDVDGSYEYKEMAAVQFGAEAFKVYPNPSASGYINVTWSGASAGARADLRDNTGRKVRSVEITGSNSPISTEGLSAGVYLLSVQTPAGIKNFQVLIQ